MIIVDRALEERASGGGPVEAAMVGARAIGKSDDPSDVSQRSRCPRSGPAPP